MFEKFQTAVRNAYLDIKNNGELHFDRAWPSPGELKIWCLNCYLQGLSKEDELVFIRFFNREQSAKELPVLIENFDLDKLRPLRNFISGETQRRPDENIVKLLAVLINFTPRPYRASDWDEQTYPIDTTKNKENDSEISTVSDDLPKEKIEDYNEEKKEIQIAQLTEQIRPGGKTEATADTIFPPSEKKKSANKTIVYALSSLVFIISVCVVLYNMNTPADCMSWNGEKYVKVDCQNSAQPYQIVGLNKTKLEHFHKITRPDTLNYNDVGKVWYSKIDNRIEFFTYPGHHPIHYEKSLKAATKHIIENYAGANVKNE